MNNRNVLILDAGYFPMGTVPVKDGLRYILKNKGISIFDSDTIQLVNGASLAAPSIIVLNEAHGYRLMNLTTQRLRDPRWSKRGVLVRDNYTCAYCDKPGDTVDHIVPRALNGPNTWLNTITACVSCNGKKGKKTLHESGMVLRFSPRIPEPQELRQASRRRRQVSFTEPQRRFLEENDMHHVLELAV